MLTMILTCETEKCQNKDLPIEVETDAQQFMCGACMTYITNAVEKPNAGTAKK